MTRCRLPGEHRRSADRLESGWNTDQLVVSTYRPRQCDRGFDHCASRYPNVCCGSPAMSGFGPPPGAPTSQQRSRRASYLPPGGLRSSAGVLPPAARRVALTNISRPGIILLRPLRLADLLDGAVKHVRRNVGPVLGWSALVNSATALPLILFGLVFGRRRSFLGGLLGADWAAFFLVVATIGSAVLLLTGVLSAPVGEAVLGRRSGFVSIWRALRPRVWTLLAGELLVTVVATLPWLLLVVVVTALLDADGLTVFSVVVFGGLSALVVNSWAMPRLIFVAPAIMLERRGVREAWKRSWELSRGRYWSIVGTFLTCGFILLFTVWIFLMAQIQLYSVIVDVLDLPYDLRVIAGLLAGTLAVLGTATIFVSFLASTTVLQYIDARIRAEGFDLVLLRAAARPQDARNVAGSEPPAPTPGDRSG